MQVPQSSRRILFALSVVGCVGALAGCGMLVGGANSIPDGETVSNQLDSLETIESTVVTEFDNGTTVDPSRTRAIRNLRTGESRATVVTGRQEGVTIGSNGTAIWMYNRSADRVDVLRTNLSLSNRSRSFETVETIFDRLQKAERGEPTEASISQLPVVPRASDPITTDASSVSIYGNVRLTYAGTESVAGRESYVVQIRPIDDEQLVGNTTMWFDTEWYYPIKTTTTVSIGEESTTTTVTYRNVTFNANVPEGTFAFDPPENATVVTRSVPETEAYDSRDALAAAAETSLPDPAVPTGFEFAEGRRSVFEGNTTVTLEYTNGTANVSVLTSPGTASTSGTGESVDISGQEGRLLDIGERSYVTWDCDGRPYTVSGSVGEETLLSVARSIECG
ncbi:DUF4367 domain-containing protein [Halorhabdus rudnickae]|uniref:DUF4367 domain-containing protein n=1 Tax=Halorhabdus rudnickae TaxID=1775544 RepID=UPI001083970B|nr:DUF4367 domain-containing protein [Halorhabdus rudnickae]